MLAFGHYRNFSTINKLHITWTILLNYKIVVIKIKIVLIISKKTYCEVQKIIGPAKSQNNWFIIVRKCSNSLSLHHISLPYTEFLHQNEILFFLKQILLINVDNLRKGRAQILLYANVKKSGSINVNFIIK